MPRLLRWQPLVGIFAGLLAAILVASMFAPKTPAPTSGPMLPDCGGPMRSVVLQYASGSTFVLPVYRQFLAECPADVEVFLACPDRAALEEFRAGVGRIPQVLTHVFTHHTMTAWSRDRWVALVPVKAGGPTTLLSPRLDSDAAAWPERAGDAKIGSDLAMFLGPRIASRTSTLAFDGGDFLADGTRVYFTEAVVSRNLQHTVHSNDELLQTLSQELRLTPRILGGAPPHHAGMFMMSAGSGAMVVADPSLGASYVQGLDPSLLDKLPKGPSLDESTQKAFDAVAAQLAADGYRVVRIPVIADIPSRVYLTYVNVILDAPRTPSAQPTCYMPTFRGADPMNDAARKVWQSLGYRVVPIDCTDVFTRGGTLHCLVNVMQRD